MGKYIVVFEPSAEIEIKIHLKSGNKAILKKTRKDNCRTF